MATLRASTSTRTSWATPFTITGRSIEFSLIRISIGYRRLPYLSIQIAVWTYRFFRWIDFQWIDSANMFLEYLPEPIAELFGFCAGAIDMKTSRLCGSSCMPYAATDLHEGYYR